MDICSSRNYIAVAKLCFFHFILATDAALDFTVDPPVHSLAGCEDRQHLHKCMLTLLFSGTETIGDPDLCASVPSKLDIGAMKPSSLSEPFSIKCGLRDISFPLPQREATFKKWRA
jgi:hypothetical protein